MGAYVTAFCIAPDARTAAERGARALIAMGLTVDEVVPKAIMIPFASWTRFVAEAWPQAVAHFPTQDQIEARLADGQVVLSPFAGFNSFERLSEYAPAR